MSNSAATDYLDQLSPSSLEALQKAHELAKECNSKYVMPIHLFTGFILIDENMAGHILKDHGLYPDKVYSFILSKHIEENSLDSEPDLSGSVYSVLNNCLTITKLRNVGLVGTVLICIQLLERNDPSIIDLLSSFSIKQTTLLKDLNLSFESSASAVQGNYINMVPTIKSDTPIDLNKDLNNLRNEIDTLRRTTGEVQINSQIQKIATLVDRVQEKGEELKAAILLPPVEDMNIQLVPSHSLERLEEYRSDESLAFLFIGLFGGSILGILVNWVTNESFVITRFSIVLLTLLLILTIGCSYIAYRLRCRAEVIRRRMLRTKVASKIQGD